MNSTTLPTDSRLDPRQVLAALDQRPTPAAYAQAARDLRALEQALPEIRIAQLSTFTSDALTQYLEVEIARVGRTAAIYTAPFNSVQQELLDPRSGCSTHQADIVFIAQLLEDVCPSLACDFLALSAADVEQLIAQTVSDCLAAITAFRRRSTAAIVVHTFPLPTAAALGIYEPMASESQTAAIRRLNRRLTEALQTIPGAYSLDFDRLCAEVGYQHWRNEKNWYMARAPLSTAALSALARLQAAFVQATAAGPRKCLVVDLDNTLWGGVIGEDGLAGIELGQTYPGNVFQDVQRAILRLYQRGVLLAICSKNNQADVDEVFQSHPDMILKPEQFAAQRINWRSKPENLIELAAELNIGLDSLVFLDDSPLECALMRQALPQVLTWEAGRSDGQSDPLHALATLQGSRIFDKLSFTAEDRRRGELYQQQSQRRQLAGSAASLAEFLAGLEMTAEIKPVDEFTFPRVVDLLQKTNQFNLTTRRYSAADLQALLAQPGCGAFTLRIVDRFGDNGVVGAAIVQVRQEVAVLDAFLLSCRVIGRQVETAFLSRVVDWAKEQGAEYLEGEFLPTAKNAPASGFYADHEFTQIAGAAAGSRWLLALDQIPFQRPAFIGEAGHARPRAATAEEDRLLRTIAAVLGAPLTSLTEDSSPDNISNWDSLNHLNMVLAIEAEYGVHLSPEDTLAMQSVGMIRKLLERPSGAATTEAGAELVRFEDCRTEHIPALKAFIAQSYGPEYVLGVNDAYFHWQYSGIPTGSRTDFSLRLALVEGRIAGCLGYIPVDVNVAGRRLRGAWLANWMVDPGHRKLGIGPLLAREITRQFEVTLALGANEEARDILARMGWTDLGTLARYVCVLDCEKAKSLTANGVLDWPEPTMIPPVRSACEIARVARFGGDAEALWDRLRDGDSAVAGTRRTTAFLQWRYVDHPQFTYRLFEARSAGKLIGFAVYRVEQARDLPVRVGRMVELVAEAAAEEPLLAALLADARAEGAAALDFFCGSRQLSPLLAGQGFLPDSDPRSRQIPVLYQPLDRRRTGIRFLADLRNAPDAAAVQQWYVTKSDGDQDRPN